MIYNIFFTKDIDIKVYDYIYPWGETLASGVWSIRESYHFTLGFMPGWAVLGRDISLNLTSIVDWRVVNARKQRQVEIDMFCKNTRQVRHGCAVGNLVYV